MVDTTRQESRGKTPALMSWSGGKDSALALAAVIERGEFAVQALLTTVTAAYDRISMHGVRRSLLRAQASTLGLPLAEVRLPTPCSHEDYAALMRQALQPWRERGVETVIHGDLFLEGIREYRERQLAQVGMRGHFPLWGRDTAQLARDFIAGGFAAVLVCVDPSKLDADFAGREFDDALLSDLPEGVDPCGEYGEFHSFVYRAPIFARTIAIERGEVVTREGFVFCDLREADENAHVSHDGHC